MPLTFIVGVYGMNFDVMPELRWKYGYLFAIGLMVAAVVVMVMFFRRRGWLGGSANLPVNRQDGTV
jgi:magnesium transporter